MKIYNEQHKKTALTAIVVILTTATLVVGGTFATLTTTTPSAAFAYKKGAHDKGKDNGKGNGDTDTDTIQNSYEVYWHSISKYKTRVDHYYNHVKDFPISEDFNNYDNSLRSDIQNISYKSINNTQFLIETIREETLKGQFQTFLTGIKNKINKYPYRNKTLHELIDEFSVMH